MKFRLLIVGISLIALIGAAYAVYVGYAVHKAEPKNAQVVGPVFQSPPSTRPDGYREYKNLLLRFDLFYPSELLVKEYDDGSSASTITFESATGTQGFQIFVVPYAQSEITKEQLKKDLPSGVILEQATITLDGAPATVFFSKNDVLGDTREVWFIHGGFLYEINTPKVNDAWLAHIMTTWRFI